MTTCSNVHRRNMIKFTRTEQKEDGICIKFSVSGGEKLIVSVEMCSKVRLISSICSFSTPLPVKIKC